MQYSFHGKKGKCYLFHFVVVCYFFKYALLCNLIKLVNILRKYATSEQQPF